MNVLALAYGYDGDDVSESYSSFCLACELAQHHNVTVLTKDPTRASARPTVHHIPTGRRWIPNHLQRALKLDYFGFNWRAWRAVRSGQLGRPELCHHLSPISLRYPDLLAYLPVPFIWGPVGGSIDYPRGFAAIARREPWLTRLRGIDRWRLAADPLVRGTMSRAARIVTTSKAAAALIPEQHRAKVVVIPEGIDASQLAASESLPGGGVHGFIFSSARLVPSKGIELLLRAYASVPLTLRLLITGDGPERARIERLIFELGVAERVVMLGSVPKRTNLALMERAAFCVFPSLKEAFGHVNLEAMGKRKAVIAVAHGGPSDIIEHDVTGVLVTPHDPDCLIAQLAAAMRRLQDHPEATRCMGVAGRARIVQQYDWPVIAQRYLALYEEVVPASCHS